MMKRRVLVLGLDGGTFDVIQPLREKGRLPNLASLMSSGSYSPLLSTVPYATIPAWPSFMTGVNAGKHGVFDFLMPAPGRVSRVVHSGDLAERTLWQVLGDYGKRSIVLNVPCTYPPQPIHGVLVSGMLTPAGANCCFPREYRETLDAQCGGYRVNEESSLSADRLLADLRVVAEKQTTAFAEALRTHRWDFAMLVFRGTDVVSHMFWEDRGAVEAFYAFVDELIGDLLCDWPDTLVIVMSDHGFQAQLKDFHVNRWLMQKGLLHTREVSDSPRLAAKRRLDGRQRLHQDLTPTLVTRALHRIGVTRQRLHSWLPERVRHWAVAHAGVSLEALIPKGPDFEVDPQQSIASAVQQFTTETKGISVFVPRASADYDATIDGIVRALYSVRDPETGAAVVAAAHRREELYHGPYVGRAPEIIFELAPGYNITNNLWAGRPITPRARIRGCHSREGVLIASGPDIRRGVQFEGVMPSLYDIAPTVLHYLGLPIPQVCDGRLLTELLASGSTLSRRAPTSAEGKRYETTQPVKARHERTKIRQRLRKLGYL
ncbi:MAG: alkaline phosphatase family protein [bacterium]